VSSEHRAAREENLNSHDDLPVVSLESLGNIFSESNVRVTIDGDLVVVVDGDEVTELEVTVNSMNFHQRNVLDDSGSANSPSEGSSLGRNTFHQATVTSEHEGVVVEDLETILVEGSSEVSLSDSETDSIGETLSERSSGDLDTVSYTEFGVTGSDRVELTELRKMKTDN
jgi:hypothetical protein